MAEHTNGHLISVCETNSTIIQLSKMDTSDDKALAKKVSFHDHVTDIDAASESSFQNGDYSQLGEEEQDLSEILNISDKINFFKTAFCDGQQTKAECLGQQTSIPEARLAFVTGMVQSPPAGNNSRADSKKRMRVEREEEDTGTVAKRDDEADTEPEKKGCYVLSVEVPSGPDTAVSEKSDTVTSNMAATQLTYSKIFATQKTTACVLNTVVDTSSILEHREELRELWEKRMMADDNQSSPSSTVLEKSSNPKPQAEEEHEEIPQAKSEGETNVHKLSNGFAKPVDNSNVGEDANANHIHEEAASKEVDSKETAIEATSVSNLEREVENNNSADSLEEDNNDDFVEEKTYTSKLENAIIMTQVKEVTSESVVSTTTVEATQVIEETAQKETVSCEEVTTTIDERDGQVVEAEPLVQDYETTDTTSESQITSSEEVVLEKEVVTGSSEETIQETVITSSSAEVSHLEEVVEITTVTEVENIVNEDDDGFVRVEECLPQVDSTEDVQVVAEAPAVEEAEQEVTSTNGYEEHAQSLATPTEAASEGKPAHPEMEQFLKSGGVKRILPGVQKTEQPYNTCTTETKIAMEIREMREREEELRIMREQALLSPVVSPVPPKSPVGRSPSPCSKEAAPSPTPSGVGYRVSSVFGHKGTVSPSPPIVSDEERRPFKTETAVEKEIRLARDREEELRRQKGLPPREDDSYVKPSQVKSSQVRVFGNLGGTNNNSIKQAATAKIQMEIEEQTQREMALRESGHIQTISQERTDAKVAKLKTPDAATNDNGNAHPMTNGNYSNGRASPDVGGPYKRSSPSPTGARPASIFSQNNGIPKGNISMHKFIASKGKETTFSAPRNGGPFQPKDEGINRAAVPPPMVKLKRNLSVESKIQQEIMEMKQREEELKKLHMTNNENSTMEGNGIDHEMNQKNNLIEYENGNGINEEEISPRHNKLIAQWEQRIQRAES